MKSFNKFVDLRYFLNYYNAIIKFGDINIKQLTSHIDSYYLDPTLFEALSKHDIERLKEDDFMTLVTMAHNCDNIICKKFDPEIPTNIIRLDDMINYGHLLFNNDLIDTDYIKDIANKANVTDDKIWYIIKHMKHDYYNAYENNVHNMIDLKTISKIYDATVEIIRSQENIPCLSGVTKHRYTIQTSVF